MGVNMKRLFLAICIILVLAVQSWAGQSIGNTADTAITTGRGYLKSIIVNTDGTNSVTIAAYDNTAASGDKLFSNIIVTTAASNRATIISFSPEEITFNTGIYIDITTSGTVTYDVYWEKR
jgi:hypothetical protein